MWEVGTGSLFPFATPITMSGKLIPSGMALTSDSRFDVNSLWPTGAGTSAPDRVGNLVEAKTLLGKYQCREPLKGVVVVVVRSGRKCWPANGIDQWWNRCQVPTSTKCSTRPNSLRLRAKARILP